MKNWIMVLLCLFSFTAWAQDEEEFAQDETQYQNETETEDLYHEIGYRLRTRQSCYTSAGVASYYWQPQALASGGRFNPNAMTAAHRYLPFGTRVRVTNANNGRSVIVTINDRGPYIGGRIIDLSRASFAAIASLGSGVTRVRIETLGCGA